MDRNSAPVFSPLAARIFGIAVIAAPLLELASSVAYLVSGDGINEGVLGATIGVWAAFALVIAFVGILRLLERRAPRAAPILTLFTLTGLSAGIAVSMDVIFASLLGPELNPVVDARIDEQPVAILALLPWIWFAPVSLVLVGIFLWRTRTTAWWTGALLIAGGILFVVSRMERIGPLALVTDAVLIAALVPIGWAILTHTRTADRPMVTAGS